MNTKAFALAITIHASLACLALGFDGPLAAEAQDTAARANPEKARFSDKGRTIVGGSLGGYWSSSASTTPDGWSVWLQPSVGYFVRDRIAVGVAPGYSTGAEATNVRYREASLGWFALVDVPLAERLSLLVQPSFGYAHRWREVPSFGLLAGSSENGLSPGFAVGAERKTDALRLELDLPIAYHLSDSVVVGLGPFVRYEYLISHQSTASAAVNGQTVTLSRFTPKHNLVHVGVQSFIGVSF